MSSWTGKTKGNLLGYKIFVKTIEIGGVGTAYFLLRFVSLYFFLFSHKSFSSLYFYFHKRQGFGVIKSVLSIYQNYYLLGQTLIDKICVMGKVRSKFSYTGNGEHYLREMAAGEGGILISAHVGNWEVAGHFLSIGRKINIVLYDAEAQKIKQYLEEQKVDHTVNIINVNNNGLEHIYKINEALARKELICIQGDRFVEGSKTVSCDFLNQKAEFPIGPFILATQLEAPVSFVFAVKDSKYHYHFFATPPTVVDSKLNRKERQEESVRLLHAYVQNLEKIVKKYPLQWFNYYQFWDINSTPNKLK